MITTIKGSNYFLEVQIALFEKITTWGKTFKEAMEILVDKTILKLRSARSYSDTLKQRVPVFNAGEMLHVLFHQQQVNCF